jgi:hypothetical protein
MQQGGWRDGMQFLHERPNAALALGVSVIMLIMDLSPMSHAAGSRPLWLKLPPIALLVIGMSILIWLIRSFWEATFLERLTEGIFRAIKRALHLVRKAVWVVPVVCGNNTGANASYLPI